MRRKVLSASKYAAAIHRSTICGSRQRHILPVTRRTAPFGFSMMLVVHKQRISAGVSLRRLTVKVSSSPSSKLAGVRILLLQPLGLLSQSGHAFLLGKFVGCVHHTLGLRTRGLGQPLGDVAHFMSTAALHQSLLAIHLLYG